MNWQQVGKVMVATSLALAPLRHPRNRAGRNVPQVPVTTDATSQSIGKQQLRSLLHLR